MQNPASLRTFGRYASLNILGMIGISCYILADTFFISLGTGAVGLAALNLAIPAFNIMNGIGQMIGVGSATHYTLCRARQQPEEADAAFTHAVRFGLAAGLLFLLLGLTAAGPLARLLGARPDTFALTTVYLRTFLLFSPFFVMNNVLLAFVRNDGDPRHAMCGMLAGSFANIIMDYVFIFPMGMGMFGAALATGFSPIISLLILSGHLRQSGRGFHLRSGRLRPALLPPLCALGLPALISEISSAVILFLFNLVLLRLAGTTGVAAYGIIANFALVGIAVFSGLSTGMQPLVSQCSGCQNDLRRLFRYGITTALAIATVLYAAVFLLAGPITAAFNSSGDPALTTYAIDGLRLYFTGFWCAGLNVMAAAFFSASGHTGCGFSISLLRGIAAIPPLLFALAALFGVRGVWCTFPAVEGVTAVLTLACIPAVLYPKRSRTK